MLSADELYRRVAHQFEQPVEERRRSYRPIANLVRPGDRVLDIGCGDGTFLEMVRERGATGIGVELDPEKALIARQKGLEVLCKPIQEVNLGPAVVDFVSMLHIVEHLTPREAISVLAAAASSLTAAGRVFLLTPNISNTVVQANFWLDVTHVRPYPRPLLCAMLSQVGLDYCSSGEMTRSLEAWAFGCRDSADAIPVARHWLGRRKLRARR